MKQRVSSLDVKNFSQHPDKEVQRIFLFKFAKPDNRQQLLVDSGFRCHLTSFARATAAAPSDFVARLRKYLKTRRVTAVAQVGTDRIIDLQFSDGQYRLFLEFYAGGNVVLTDRELNVLALLRIVSGGSEEDELRVGLKYSLDHRQNYGGVPALTKQRLADALQGGVGTETADVSKKSRRKPGSVLRKALATSITEFPPMLVDHALSVSKFDANLLPEQVLQDDELIDRLMSALQEAERVVQHITSSGVTTGYIIAKTTKATQEDQADPSVTSQDSVGEGLIYEDFHPFKPRQFEVDPNVTILSFDGFNRTLDEFFSSIEGQRLESRLQDREANAKKKLESARRDHEKRLGGLQSVQELNVRKAQAIEANVQRVEEAVGAVNGLIAQGMDWVEIARLIEMEQQRQNAVAQIIKLPLKLYENTATLLLNEADDEDDYEGDSTDSDVSDSEEEDAYQPKQKPTEKQLAIDVDLALSPWANARQYHEQKRSAAVKEQKTLQSSSKALKSTERKIAADLKKGLKQEKQVLRPVRQQFWFEKFIFFISSDGYMVLGGKELPQNEILYKRYLKRGDVFVHADLQGAAMVIIKNNPATPDASIPPSTLSQAGNLSVATSVAWESKAVMSAWWVESEQVSKIASTGDYLPTGTFSIKGQKNFLPPAQLLLGFGVMFHISDESQARHIKHRVKDVEVKLEGMTPAPVDGPQMKSDTPTAEEERDGDSDGASQADSDTESDLDSHAVDQAQSNPLQTENTSVVSGEPADSEDEAHDVSEADQEHEEADNEKNDREGEASSVLEAGKSIDGVRPFLQEGHIQEAAQEQEHIEGGQHDTEGEATSVQQVGKSVGGGRLFVREEQPKEGGVNTGTSHEPGSEADELESAARNSPGVQSNVSSAHPLNKPTWTTNVRGKRGKQKKKATKYANQDEEDRELAMKLLGSAAARKKADEEAASKRVRDEALAFQKQRRREQHERAAREGRAHEAKRLARGDEGKEDEGEEVLPDVQVALTAFTGAPLPGDDLLAAIPVCAPLAALATYKYKAKLQPGGQKKGKAVKEILGRWTAAAGVGAGPKSSVDDQAQDSERPWPIELELIRAWRDVEIINVVPVGKVRVMMSGGAAAASTSGRGGEKGKGKSGGGGRGGKGGKKKR
ncbi:MAG: hypothetical protein M1832_001518 [Thelocarpon impressellum]|nr:MAG: hypothetical protein M1832_001518 [Thelocarpon impressellum]